MTQWEMHVAHSQRAFPGSSCFDLRGIRAELARALLQEGHLPWISEEQQFEYLQSGTLPLKPDMQCQSRRTGWDDEGTDVP